MCSTDISYLTPVKVYTQKEIVLIETLISKFHKKNYKPEIQKLAFHFPHVSILRTHNCGKEIREAFKHWIKHHYV